MKKNVLGVSLQSECPPPWTRTGWFLMENAVVFDLMGESDGMIWAACSKFRDLNRCETNALSNSGMGQNRYTIQCEASTINHSYWSYVHQLSYRTGIAIFGGDEHLRLSGAGTLPEDRIHDWFAQWDICDTSSTAQGGGGSFKNGKPIGEVSWCRAKLAERTHWWTERCLKSPTLALSFSGYLPTYLSIFYVSIYLSIYISLSFI